MEPSSLSDYGLALMFSKFLPAMYVRSSLMCLRGPRSSSGSPGVPAAVDLVVAEGHLATSSEQ